MFKLIFLYLKKSVVILLPTLLFLGGFIVDAVINSISLCLEYMFFLYAIPYLAGSSLQTLSRSVIWRAAYYVLSGIGTILYKALEVFFNIVICGILSKIFRMKIDAQNSIAVFFNLVMYAIVIYILMYFNEICTEIIFGINGFGFDYGDNAKGFSIVENLSAIGYVISSFFETWNIKLFVIRLFCWVISMSLFLVYSTIYYSIVFGLLENKVDELHLLSRNEEDEDNILSRLSGDRTFTQKIFKDVRDFVDDICIMKHFRNKIVLVISVMMCAVSSVIIVRMGGEVSTTFDIIKKLLTESGVLDTIAKFVIVIAFNILLQLACLLIIKLRSPEFRERVNGWRHRSIEIYYRAREQRRQWAIRHDILNRDREDNDDTNRGSRIEDLRRMEFE